MPYRSVYQANVRFPPIADIASQRQDPGVTLKTLFDRLRGRPHDISAERVAELLCKFRDNTASHSEWDFFCTGLHIADPRLEEIRRDAEELHGPRVEPYTSDRLNELIARAEALSAARR